jgi:hypothetical protein
MSKAAKIASRRVPFVHTLRARILLVVAVAIVPGPPPEKWSDLNYVF